MSNSCEHSPKQSVAIPQYAERLKAIALAAASLKPPVSISDERLAYLADRAKRTLVAQRLQGASGLKTEDRQLGIYTDIVDESWPLTDRAAAASLVAKINFVPTIDGSEVLTAHPGHATRFAHQAIAGVQNLVLLAGAGFIDTPDMLVGDTNLEMSRIARRVGFTAFDTYVKVDEEGEASEVRERIEAPFTDVSARIFSEEVLAFDAMLSLRLA